MLIACLKSEIDRGKIKLLHLKSRLSKFTTVLHRNRYLCLHGCRGCCDQNGRLYSWGAYFMWLHIILILQDLICLEYIVQCGVDSVHDCPGQHIFGLAHRILKMANGTADQ